MYVNIYLCLHIYEYRFYLHILKDKMRLCTYMHIWIYYTHSFMQYTYIYIYIYLSLYISLYIYIYI